MLIKEKALHIIAELKGHAPFTIFGAVMGVIFMLIFKNLGKTHASLLFGIFHPAHVVLSAMVTASIFKLHRKAKNIVLILIIGYIGSIGIATLSDSIVPYMGESLLGLHVSAHDSEDQDQHSDTSPSLYLGFIEDWYIVNPAALLGIMIAYFIPRTKLPHAGHVLISTWASSSHILMNISGEITLTVTAAIFVVLFVAVWLPCCISDIVFPLLFVKSDLKLTETCKVHSLHSHEHTESP